MQKNTAKQLNPAPPFNLGKFIKLCFSKWLWFVASVIACVLVALAIMVIRKPAYEVDAQVMLPPESGSPGMMMMDMAQSLSLGDFLGGSSSTDNEVAVMRSHNVFLNTAKDLGLNVSYFQKKLPLVWIPQYTEAPFKLTTLPSIPDTLQVPITFKISRAEGGKVNAKVLIRKKTVAELKNKALPLTINTDYGPFTLEKTPYFDSSKGNTFKIVYTSYNAAADDYVDIVDIFVPNKRTDFIDLAYVTNDPAFGEVLLQTIIKNYNNVGITYKTGKNNETLDFVNDRLASLTKELSSSEINIERFKKEHGLTEVEYDAAALIEKSGRMQNSMLFAQTENEVLAMTSKFIHDPENRYALIPFLSGTGDLSTSTEIGAYNELVLERMKMQSSAKVNNASLKLIEEQLDAMRQGIINSVDQALASSNVKLREIKKESSSTQSRIGALPSIEREYLDMKRLQMVQEQIYLFLLKQREEVSMSIAKTSPSIVVIDEPHTLTKGLNAKPIFMLAFAVLIGLLLPLIWILLRAIKKAPLSNADEIKALAKAPVAGTIAADTDGDGLPILAADNPSAESLRRLRTDLQFIMKDFDGKVVLVTSANPGEGKTFVAVNLAISLALTGKRVLLIDAGLRDAQVASILGLAQAPGLADTAASRTNVQRYAKADLDVITAGSNTDRPAELLSSANVHELIERLKADYDYIIIDTSAIKPYSDTYSLAPMTDLTIFVARTGVANPADIELANDLVAAGRMPRVAIVANSSKPGK